jgi:hypothetical protein
VRTAELNGGRSGCILKVTRPKEIDHDLPTE